MPDGELKTHAKDIIDAADRYSIINLKLEAEAAYVKSTDITMDNVMEDHSTLMQRTVHYSRKRS